MKLNLSRNTIITGLIILIFFILLAIYWKKYGIPGLGGGDQEHFNSTSTTPLEKKWRLKNYIFPSPIINLHSDKMSHICKKLYWFARNDKTDNPTQNKEYYARLISHISELSMYPVELGQIADTTINTELDRQNKTFTGETHYWLENKGSVPGQLNNLDILKLDNSSPHIDLAKAGLYYPQKQNEIQEVIDYLKKKQRPPPQMTEFFVVAKLNTIFLQISLLVVNRSSCKLAC